MELNSKIKLTVSILIDILGYGSYALPGTGEITDIVFAFIEAGWIRYAYNTTPGAIFGWIEEILPGTDFIPACTIVHIIKKREEEKKETALKAIPEKVNSKKHK